MIAQIAQKRILEFMGRFHIVFLLASFLGISILVIFSMGSKWIPYSLLALVFPFVLLISGAPKKILLFLILLDIPLQLDVSLGYLWILEYTGTINGYIVSLTTICLVILYIMWGLELLGNKTLRSLTLKIPDRFLTLYLAVTCFSIIIADLRKVASYEIFVLIQVFLLYFYLINNIKERAHLVFILAALSVGLIFESTIIVLVRVLGQGFSIPGIMASVYGTSVSPEGANRIAGTLTSANSAASYICLLLVPAISLIFTGLRTRFQLLGGLAAVLGSVALLLTGSRGGWLAASISLSLFSIYSIGKGWLNKRVFVIIGLIGLLILLVFWEPITNRILGDDAASAASRIPQYKIAWRIIQDHPIFGVGANNYYFFQQRYLAANPDTSVFRWAVHNKYLLVWAETGILSLIFFVAFLISTIKKGFILLKVNDKLLTPVALGLSVAVIGQMVHMFFDVFHSRPQVQLLWVIAGLLLVTNSLSQEETIRRPGGSFPIK